MIESAKASIHANMKAAGVTGLLISQEDVQRIVFREIVRTSLAKRDSRNKSIIFGTLKGIFLDSIAHDARAYHHKFRKYAGRCFYAWSDWTYQIGTGLERKRWKGPRKYEVPNDFFNTSLLYSDFCR
jgi:hypothetical protein